MMQLRNSSTAYGWIAITLHWTVAAAVFAMFGLGLWMRRLNYYDSWYHAAPELHKSVGILLLLILICRLIWRIINIRPNLIGSHWEQFLALLVHRTHYILLFSLLLTGYLIPTAEGVGIDIFGWFTIPALLILNQESTDLIGRLHLYCAWSVIALACLHSAAALKHHLIDRDQTLLRMLYVTKRR
ncbi:MAG: cytochrome b [Mariprofundales bacterium]|nr:cytochrome b [Mariprofundales bacterium]